MTTVKLKSMTTPGEDDVYLWIVVDLMQCYDKNSIGLPEYHRRVVLQNTHPVILFLKISEEVQMSEEFLKTTSIKVLNKQQGALVAVI